MSPTADPRDRAIGRVRRFCEERSVDDVRLEVEARGSRLTIVELRPAWDAGPGADWSRQPIAQLRHDADGGTWSLFWPRHTGRWECCGDEATATDVAPLLAEIAADPDGVFWG